MRFWRVLAVMALFLLGGLLFLLSLSLTWSIQWIGVYAFAVGALAVWGFAGMAAWAVHRRRPLQPWMIRSGMAVAASLVVTAISWSPIEASFRRHHHTQVSPILATQRGIIRTSHGPFSPDDFAVSNAYVGPLGGDLVTIYAGDKPGTGGGFTAGVRIYTRPAGATSTSSDKLAGDFLAPRTLSYLTIESVTGARVGLRYQDGQTVVYDLNKDSFE